MFVKLAITSLLSLAVQGALAQSPAFKSFARSKIQISKATIDAGAALLVIVDNRCLSSQFPSKAKAGLSGHLRASDHVQLPMPVQAVGYLSAGADDLFAAEQDPCVLGVTENSRVFASAMQGDPLENQQLHLSAIQTTAGDGYFYHPIWGVRQPVVAAVVDSGIQLDHPDLRSRIWRGSKGEVGFDFANNDVDPSDDFGHGTHVAGLIGAQRDNGVGVRGVMGDLVRLMAVKTQGADGGGSVADVVNGILWAADHGAEVMNLSITTTAGNPALEDALAYALAKNIVIAAAAGNDGQEITPANFVTPVAYAIDRPGLIGVGAIDALSLLASGFSNFSTHYVEISAPGNAGTEGLLSTFLGSGYRKISGTSMASPQVAAGAALTISFCKTRGVVCTNAQVESMIEASALESQPLTAKFVSGRRFDLERLGRLLFNTEIVDATGGFDDP